MSPDLILAFLAFTFIGSITPGPNNMMLMASGANFGFARTIPHILGISVGFVIMVTLVGIGLMRLFDAYPPIYTALKVVSVLYLLWLAWKIATAAAPDGAGPASRPMSFLQAAAFQWVNPKAWTMALSIVTLYAPDRTIGALAFLGVAYVVAALPSASSWTVLGREMRRFLDSPTRLTAFNWTMAGLLVLSLWPVITH